jgi:phasin
MVRRPGQIAIFNEESAMADINMSTENTRAMLRENLDRVRKSSADYFDMLEKGLTSSQLPVAGQAKPFCDYMRQQVTSAFDLCDKLIQSKDAQETMRVQADFFQQQMRALTDHTKTMGESALKAATSAFAPKK